MDFIFYPEDKKADCLILELKVDHTPEEAIQQIKEKRYALKFKGKIGADDPYTGRILAVGIGYDKKLKNHQCKIEVLKYFTLMIHVLRFIQICFLIQKNF